MTSSRPRSLEPKDHAERVALFRAQVLGPLTCAERHHGEQARVDVAETFSRGWSPKVTCFWAQTLGTTPDFDQLRAELPALRWKMMLTAPIGWILFSAIRHYTLRTLLRHAPPSVQALVYRPNFGEWAPIDDYF